MLSFPYHSQQDNPSFEKSSKHSVTKISAKIAFQLLLKIPFNIYLLWTMGFFIFTMIIMIVVNISILGSLVIISLGQGSKI